MRTTDAPGQDQDRVLQRRQPQEEISGDAVRFPRVYLQAKGGEEQQAQQHVCELHPCGQQQGGQGDAGNDTQTELSESDATELGGYFPITQSGPAGLAGVLRKILPFGDVSRL